MKSHITKKFKELYNKLPKKNKILSKKNYKLWKKNNYHPSLNFKQISNKSNTYSIRVGIGWRALGVKSNNNMIWFWIGSHEDYNKLIKR